MISPYSRQQFTVAKGLIAVFAATFFGSAAAAPQILSLAPSEKVAAARAKSSISRSSAYASTFKTASTAVVFDAATLHSLAVNEEAVFSLPNGQSYIYVARSVTRDDYGNVSWVGQLKNGAGRHNVVATTGPAGTFASIDTPEDEWMIVPGENGEFVYLINGSREAALSEIRPNRDDAVAVPEEIAAQEVNAALRTDLHLDKHSDQYTPIQNLPQPNLAKAAPTPQQTVDVMVVVTQGFASFHGANLETRLAQAFAGANTSLTNSEVAITLRKVGPTIIRNYPDATAAASSTELDAITNNTGVFSDIEDLRWAYGADLVTLIRQPQPNSGSGIAWLGKFRVISGAEVWSSTRNMYSVVDLCNFSGCDSGLFAHELGHNMGLAHDQANAPSAPSRPYAYGWKVNSGNNARNFRTVMSYAPPSRSVPVFANPNLFICNPAGWSPADACGQANVADTARALNENRGMVAAIKTATQLVLSTPASAASTATSTTVQVSRTGGSTQAISVNYATANGTAIAGTDYTATSGTLNWAANDSAAKTITIALVPNSSAKGRTFSLVLSNPLRTTVAAPSQVTVMHAGTGGGSSCRVSPP